MAVDPHRCGRSVVVAPGGAVPVAWDGVERVRVEAIAADVADVLDAAWRERQPRVVELVPDLGLDDPATPPQVADRARQPWELRPDHDLLLDRLHHGIWANSIDGRGDVPRHRWSEAAAELGATAGDVEGADVVLPDGTPAVCDGGPLDVELGERAGAAVVHRVSLEHGELRALGPNACAAALAPDQLDAVTHPGGGARVIAPAGSGKTRVLTERARLLVDGWHIPTSALAVVAFNRRAAEELRERTTDLPGLRIRTLNALGLRLLPQGIRTIEEPAARDHLGALVKLARRADTDPASPWLDALSRVRLALMDPAAVELELPDVAGLEEVARGYRERLRRAGEVDFDEQVVMAIERLLTDPPFRHRAQRFARLLLVDEFQDLTPAHLLLLRLLAGPAGAVYGVGDDDQTIYGYAGATPRWLVDFTTYFPGSGVHALEVNYRCPEPVVRAAANLLTRNAVRVRKEIHAAPGASADPATFAVVAGGDDPAGATARAVRVLLEGGVQARDVAVLARVNSVLAPVQVLLRHHGAGVRGGVDERFLNRGGVRAALAWLRVASAPDDGIPGPALREAARRPKRGLGDRVLGWISEQRSVPALLRLADRINTPRDAEKVADLAADVAIARQAVAKGGDTAAVLTLVRDRVGSGGLGASAQALDGWSRGAVSSHADDLDALSALAALEPDVAEFGRWLAGELRAPPDPDGVTLASIHAVKGQEWDHVLVHHVSDGLLPHRLVDDIEEERRVLHVALTRGRTSVQLVAGATPSPFLTELAEPGSPPPPRARVVSAGAGRARVAAPDVDYDPAVFEQLRAWRAARASGKPAYTVFTDATLKQIAARRPRDETELRAIAGVGPAKLESYGEELLALLSTLG